ncbi:hypothetical protein [Novosphingopyxis baekryungensis]|uniref:hypothetical protein n=1 Tax=Novosphingopyxis baekryungensis TaxID=279369 RepID=UPI0003B67880|nr:hypothetical protein [Novosphingopyxis baekryungensis]
MTLLCGGQLALILFGLLALAFWPPQEGRLIVVPLTRAAASELLPRALTGQSRLIGSGPLGGSYILWGRRGAVQDALRGQASLVFAAPRSGCGAIQAIVT